MTGGLEVRIEVWWLRSVGFLFGEMKNVLQWSVVILYNSECTTESHSLNGWIVWFMHGNAWKKKCEQGIQGASRRDVWAGMQAGGRSVTASPWLGTYCCLPLGKPAGALQSPSRGAFTNFLEHNLLWITRIHLNWQITDWEIMFTVHTRIRQRTGVQNI